MGKSRDPIATYLKSIDFIRSTASAVDETSYYGPLAVLLNSIGDQLRPKVHCVINIQNRGAGIPDGGLFAADQLQTSSDGTSPIRGQLPARGAIEAKPPSKNLISIATSPQVAKYLATYGAVLVTNFRGFGLTIKDDSGKPRLLETYEIAASESEFWRAASDWQDTSRHHAVTLAEYLQRVLINAAPIGLPRDLAWLLASYARESLIRVERSDLANLVGLKKALEESLGIKFEGSRGNRFFRSSLVQTIFYGLFSAWVLWHREHADDDSARFNWHEATWTLHVPMIHALFDQIATPSRLGPLGLVEILNWAADALNRVKRKQFFQVFDESEAVQYFYEPFLQAFDADLRKQLGVWFTPREIVRYQVERVDQVLRDKFEIEDGLADERVYVLDPCVGTGSYLVEVLRKVERTLRERGDDGFIGQDIRRAAQERILGFELLPAPFVITHLQIGLLLDRMNAPLSHERNERAGVYLTNSLTGWTSPGAPMQSNIFPELEAERDAAQKVKNDTPILVIIGNPPYNGFAGVAEDEEKGLLDAYKTGLASWNITKNYLDDLYVRFFRVAENKIAEHGGRGIVCYISNFSYLREASYVVMRERYLRNFDEMWFDNLNGDSRETGKMTPAGKPDPSIFSTPYNREGIQVGTTIGLLVKTTSSAESAKVNFRQFWGKEKREELLAVLNNEITKPYESIIPRREHRYAFRSLVVSDDYLDWPLLADLCEMVSLGLNENRKSALITMRHETVATRMQAYFSGDSTSRLKALGATGLVTDAARYDAKDVRATLRRNEIFEDRRIVRFLSKPFDVRWAYLTGSKLWNEARAEFVRHTEQSSGYLMLRRNSPRANDGAAFLFSSVLGDQHALNKDAYFIPIGISQSQGVENGKQTVMFSDHPTSANLSRECRLYLKGLGLSDDSIDGDERDILWMHALAIGYAPLYLQENADGVRLNWPRIPLPGCAEQLRASAVLGRELARLVDAAQPYKGIDSGKLRTEMRTVGTVKKDVGPVDPNRDFDLTTGWGHLSEREIVMPGRGKVIRRTEEGLPEEITTCMGSDVCDVYLNEEVYWTNIPWATWTYKIGGFLVLKKWLSYRDTTITGHPLSLEQVREFTSMSRRITAIIMMEKQLNRNYQDVRSKAVTLPTVGREINPT